MDSTPHERGTPLDELETPCLIVEVDALESNYRVVSNTYRDTVCKMRQHTKNIKSPFLAKMQMDFGGTNGGVCTAKVAEAEIMVEGGITDILIPNQVVTDDKLDECAPSRGMATSNFAWTAWRTLESSRLSRPGMASRSAYSSRSIRRWGEREYAAPKPASRSPGPPKSCPASPFAAS